MNVIKQKIKALWQALSEIYGTKDDINSEEDYRRVKKWNKKAVKTYLSRAIVFTVVAILFAVLINAFVELNFFVELLLVLFYAVMGLYVSVAFASMKLHKKEVKKSVFKAAITGYKVGRQFEHDHYTVKHEFNDTYSVTKRTDNDGCLYAVIFAGLQYMVWTAFCSRLAPFLTFKKYKANQKEMEAWREKQGNN